MTERLLTMEEVAQRLGVVKRSVQRYLPKLMARGLQRVKVGPHLVRFREASLDRIIKRAAEREEPLF